MCNEKYTVSNDSTTTCACCHLSSSKSWHSQAAGPQQWPRLFFGRLPGCSGFISLWYERSKAAEVFSAFSLHPTADHHLFSLCHRDDVLPSTHAPYFSFSSGPSNETCLLHPTNFCPHPQAYSHLHGNPSAPQESHQQGNVRRQC